jgi:hypothetical protein
MSHDLCAVFSKPPADLGDDEYNRWYDDHLYEILATEGFTAARRFRLSLRHGSRSPAHLRYLSLYETDGPMEQLRQDLADERPNMELPPWFDGIEFASWMCRSIGDGGDIVMPPHLYLNLSSPPPEMTFDDYSDWYDIHQKDNIANTAALGHGWRYRLDPNNPDDVESPTHLALYRLDGDIEQMAADLDRATAADSISLPRWFRRAASLEAEALTDRVTPTH